MADSKTTALTAITTASNALLYVVNDTTGTAVSRKMAFDVGTYTPTLTNTTNIASSAAFVTNYFRLGSIVHVAGVVTIDTTSTGATILGISLPIASDLASLQQLAGTANMYTSAAANETGQVVGDATNNRAQLRMFATSTAANNWAFSFTYLVV